MFIAMNRFRITPGRESEFEEIWRQRDSQLDEVPGFRSFQLLRGPQDEEACLYASHTVWDSQDDFEAWTRSEAFRRAHSGGGGREGLYLGPPRFEGFEVVL
jgi:heme-degrading monooxygenase HmoA